MAFRRRTIRAGGTVVANEVVYVYTGWGRVVATWQCVTGAVTAGTAAVRYEYGACAAGAAANQGGIGD